MSISVKCPDCGKALKAPDALAGQKAKCPDCGAVVKIPSEAWSDTADVAQDADHSDVDNRSADAPAEDDVARKPCPMCGEMIPATAVKCRFCGEMLDARTARASRRSNVAGNFAGVWLRFVALVVDGFLLAILIAIAAGLVIGGIAGGAGGINRGAVENLQKLIAGAVTWLYYALQESSGKQATIGKRLMRIHVSDLAGNRVSFLRATGRHFGKALSVLLCLLGYIIAAFTEKKQALHDLLAGTLVVRD